MTGDLPEKDFDYSQPFEVDIGRAAVLAEALREYGSPHCTADVVTAELAKPENERSMIGRFAADAPALRAGRRGPRLALLPRRRGSGCPARRTAGRPGPRRDHGRWPRRAAGDHERGP